MGLSFVRYGIPSLFVLAGVVVAIWNPDGVGLEAWSLFTGAGLAVLLLNVLHRMGVEGDADRDKEAKARAYFDRHGHWPDQRP
jgi:hypothetical protein